MADDAAAMRVKVMEIYFERQRLAHWELYIVWADRYYNGDVNAVPDSSVRPRCGELEREGCLRDSGQVLRNPETGKRQVVWEWVPPEEREAEKARWWARYRAKHNGAEVNGDES